MKDQATFHLGKFIEKSKETRSGYDISPMIELGKSSLDK